MSGAAACAALYSSHVSRLSPLHHIFVQRNTSRTVSSGKNHAKQAARDLSSLQRCAVPRPAKVVRVPEQPSQPHPSSGEDIRRLRSPAEARERVFTTPMFVSSHHK